MEAQFPHVWMEGFWVSKICFTKNEEFSDCDPKNQDLGGALEKLATKKTPKYVRDHNQSVSTEEVVVSRDVARILKTPKKKEWKKITFESFSSQHPEKLFSWMSWITWSPNCFSLNCNLRKTGEFRKWGCFLFLLDLDVSSSMNCEEFPLCYTLVCQCFDRDLYLL